MGLGFVMLCHTALERAAQTARYWASAGCPVVIHVDAKAPAAEVLAFRNSLKDVPNLKFVPQIQCYWGTWSLIEATLSASKILLESFPNAQHVCLVSGSCLPLRPVSDLQTYLADHPETDFIESVMTRHVRWTAGGLDLERFTLHFPFSWTKQKRLFDAYVTVQRAFGLRRKIPERVVPHMGSQWWCLTRQTLTTLLEDPDHAKFNRYFRGIWIPDETYFQSLVRLYSKNIESRSLTLSKFDPMGRPHVFYDDHLQLLRRSDCFMVRKIWPKANQLYHHFLAPEALTHQRAAPAPGKITRLFAQAGERRTRGRPGLYMQSRFPDAGREFGQTCAPYSIFCGFSDVLQGFAPWLEKAVGGRVHGHLFAKDRAEFAGNAPVYNGCLSDSASLRDHNPQSFLTNLLWNTRGERQVFQFDPRDQQDIATFIAQDKNAQIAVISGAWAVPLFHLDQDFDQKRETAAQLQRIETEFLTLLRQPWVRAHVQIWTLADFIENPHGQLQDIVRHLGPNRPVRPTEMPAVVDLAGLGPFLQHLRNHGMPPMLMGDFSPDQSEPSAHPHTPRPKILLRG